MPLSQIFEEMSKKDDNRRLDGNEAWCRFVVVPSTKWLSGLLVLSTADKQICSTPFLLIFLCFCGTSNDGNFFPHSHIQSPHRLRSLAGQQLAGGQQRPFACRTRLLTSEWYGCEWLGCGCENWRGVEKKNNGNNIIRKERGICLWP